MMNSVGSLSSVADFTSSIKTSPAEVMFRKASTAGAAIHSASKVENSNNVVQLKKPKDEIKDESLDLVKNASEDDNYEEEYTYPPEKNSHIDNSFESLAVAVGAINGKITKQQLIGYLQSLIVKSMQGDGNIDEVKFLRGILTQFDNISNGEDYITSLNGVDTGETYGAKQELPAISTMEMEA